MWLSETLCAGGSTCRVTRDLARCESPPHDSGRVGHEQNLATQLAATTVRTHCGTARPVGVRSHCSCVLTTSHHFPLQLEVEGANADQANPAKLCSRDAGSGHRVGCGWPISRQGSAETAQLTSPDFCCRVALLLFKTSSTGPSYSCWVYDRGSARAAANTRRVWHS